MGAEILASCGAYWTPQFHGLRDLLDKVASGDIQVPAFHRDYLHSDSDVVALLGMVCDCLPIGMLILAEATGGLSCGARAVTGTNQSTASNKKPTHLIVDGQQRLTSLFLALQSEHPVRFVQPNGRQEHRLYYFNVDKALDDDLLLSDAVFSISVTADGSPTNNHTPDFRQPQKQYANLIVPTNRVFSFSDWEGECAAWWNARHREAAPDIKAICLDFQRTLINPLVRSHLLVTTMDGEVSARDVIRTYERANAHGSAPRSRHRLASPDDRVGRM